MAPAWAMPASTPRPTPTAPPAAWPRRGMPVSAPASEASTPCAPPTTTPSTPAAAGPIRAMPSSSTTTSSSPTRDCRRSRDDCKGISGPAQCYDPGSPGRDCAHNPGLRRYMLTATYREHDVTVEGLKLHYQE